MTEVNITQFFNSAVPRDLSASCLEAGPNAGPETFGAAMAEAELRPILTTPEQLKALRDHVEAMGFGEDVQSYGETECNALMIQLISSDMREADMGPNMTEQDWEEYEAGQDNGTYASNIFRGVDGGVYFALEG